MQWSMVDGGLLLRLIAALCDTFRIITLSQLTQNPYSDVVQLLTGPNTAAIRQLRHWGAEQENKAYVAAKAKQFVVGDRRRSQVMKEADWPQDYIEALPSFWTNRLGPLIVYAQHSSGHHLVLQLEMVKAEIADQNFQAPLGRSVLAFPLHLHLLPLIPALPSNPLCATFLRPASPSPQMTKPLPSNLP